MLFNHYPRHRSLHGFSLAEIMVAVVVGMLGILIIMQVFLVAEGQKRTTTGGADAQENALMAMYTLERELRIAGLGLFGLTCATVNSWNGATAYSFKPWPVTIRRNQTRNAAGNLVAAAGTDLITVLYSNSGFGSLPTTLTAPAAISNVRFTVANGDGFNIGDLAIVSQGALDCTVTQISAAKVANGTAWNLATNGLDYNAAVNNFPAGGYAAGATLTNMGNMVNHEYYVLNNNLMMRDVNLPASATNPMALVNGIVSIRAQYGRDTDANGYLDAYDNTAPATMTEVVAVRLAVVARGGQLEKEVVTPGDPAGTLVLWSGGTTGNGGAITLDATAQHYRYKTYQSTIPLRNVLWNN